MTAPPWASNPTQALTPADTTTSSNTDGNVARQRRAISKKATEPSPKAMAGRCICCGCASAAQPPVRPSRAGNCDAMMSTAAPWVKAISTGALTRLSSQPNRTKPSTTCTRPDSRASHTASSIHCALPGAAMPVSEALTSKQVRAVGPTDRRMEPLNSTAISAGSMDA